MQICCTTRVDAGEDYTNATYKTMHGLHILKLCQYIDVAINKLWLDYNGLTTHLSSLISELAVKCKVKKLVIISIMIILERTGSSTTC